MDVRHWTEDDFLNRLYSVGRADEDHLTGCPECRARLAQLEARRAAVTAEPEVAHEFLAAQRRAVYRRLGERPSHARIWAPAFAAMLTVAIGLMVYGPDHRAAPAPPQQKDDVVAEIYAVEQSSEPAVAKPMQALFEEN